MLQSFLKESPKVLWLKLRLKTIHNLLIRSNSKQTQFFIRLKLVEILQ